MSLKAAHPVEWIERAFGKMENAGAFCFGDQRLLLLPVRSYYGTFAWVTCPLVLRRLQRDGVAAGNPFDFLTEVPTPAKDEEILLYKDTALTDRNVATVFLEDLDLQSVRAGADAVAEGLAKLLFADTPAQRDFRLRFGVVSDAMFIYLCETATEVTARISLDDDTKTVKPGGLWYEESVPAETVFCGPVLIDTRFQADAEAFFQALPHDSLIQVGGKASIGRGLCRVVVK